MHLPTHIRTVQAKAECVYTRQDIENALDQMAEKINNELAELNPILLCVMVGGLIPAGNLLPRLNFPLEVDYIHATRYRGAMRGGEIHWVVKPRCDLKDRIVLVVDDILDGGITLMEIVNFCQQAQAKEVKTAVLLDKKDVRLEGGLPQADYTGLTVGDGYVFGYGMDYKEYLRNAPGIFMVAPEHQ